MRLAVAALATAAACGGPPPAPEPVVAQTSERIEITLYRDGDARAARPERVVLRPDGNSTTLEARAFSSPVALIVETTRVALSGGKASLVLARYPDAAAPASLWIGSRTAPTRVTVDSFAPRRSPATSLVGLPVRVVDGETRVEGVVVGMHDSRLRVEDADGRTWLVGPGIEAIETAVAPGAQAARVDLSVGAAGAHVIELGYTTDAIDWRLDYRARIRRDASAPLTDAGDVELELVGLLTIDNRTGVSYPDARIAVQSGTLATADRHPIRVWRGRASLPAHGELGIPLRFATRGARVSYVYRAQLDDELGDQKLPAWGQTSSREVMAVLELTCDSVLPMGPIRLEVSATTGTRAPHPPVVAATFLRERVRGGERAVVRMGSAPALRGRRRQIGTRRSGSGDELFETIELEISNAGPTPATVRILERLNRSSRFELQRSRPEGQVRGDELTITLEVPAGGRARARYTVAYAL